MPSSSAIDGVATAFTALKSGTHGRERRLERSIEKIDLQRAKKYGMAELQRNGRVKYTYGGVVFIYDPEYKTEVTSWASPDFSSDDSGTKVVKPLLLEKKKKYETEKAKLRHHLQRTKIYGTPEKWSSHTVIVVDMSGSMRRDDLNGAKCRSDGVWLVLARDFIGRQLRAKTCNEYDLVSVILMMDGEAQLLYRCEPMDWVLYNMFVGLREWSTIRPSGRGYYGPALELAERVLKVKGNCAVSLVFISDGRPSDEGNFGEHVGALAKEYRRRLTLCCIGMAQDENFSVLNDMVTEAQNYGSVASFHKPLLDARSLSKIMTSFGTSMTLSKTELTNSGGISKAVKDVQPERKDAPDDDCVTEEWKVYSSHGDDKYVRRIWSWSYIKNQFVYLKDPRCIVCYNECVATFSISCGRKMGMQCPNCQACVICMDCMEINSSHVQSATCYRFLKDLRIGQMIDRPLPSFSVAMKVPIFEEGAERIVHKFRFLNEKGEFAGPKMVAKESRFVEEEGSYQERMDYHQEFMRTQALASEFAKKFNAALNTLANHFEEEYHSWLQAMPRVTFLEPLVVEVINFGQEFNMLVEPLLEGKYEKFNNNMGYVKGQSKSVVGDRNDLGLGAIAEEGSDEEESEEEGLFDTKENKPTTCLYQDVEDHHFPQAFSHYSYEMSKRQLMVVDLQGILEVRADGLKQYILTDPVIHKRRKRRSNRLRNWTFGRTDRGERGMSAFFQTHKCSDVCRLLGLQEQDTEP